MTVRLGFAFVPGFPPSALRSIARAVEDAGLDELWVWEDCFKESGIASAAIALGATERITVGIGLLPTPLRNVALTAMELATIGGAFPGRLIGGVGNGVREWMVQTGAAPASPLTLLREYTTALRALLGGETLTTEGRYVRLDRVALDWPPASAVPVMIGAGGPKGVHLAGEVADGLIIAGGRSTAEVAEAAGWAREGAGGADVPVVAGVTVARGDGAAERLGADLALYRDDPPPEAGIVGSAREVADLAAAFARAGATSLVFQPTGDDPDPEELIRFLGEEVAPIVRGT